VRAALFGLISNYTLLILAQVLGGITSATIGVMTVLVVTDFQAPDMTWRRPLRWLAERGRCNSSSRHTRSAVAFDRGPQGNCRRDARI
jgi:hypothetical protein